MKKSITFVFFACLWVGEVMGQSYSSTIIAGINEIAGTGTSVILTASAASSTSSGALPIGFTFNFYGNAYTDFYINPNGTLSFGSANQTYLSSATNPIYANAIPSTNAPNNFIGFAYTFPFNDGTAYYPDYSAANVNYLVSGAAPNRILVVNFKNVGINGSFTIAKHYLNIQIQLYENDNKIEVHNTNNASILEYYGYHDTQQVGVENIDGTNGTSATCLWDWNLDNKIVRFTYSSVAIPTNVTPNTAICNATSQQTVNLSATCSTGTATWYKDDGSCIATIGTLLTSTIVAPTLTTLYKVRCENGSSNTGFVTTKITVTNSNPSIPSAIYKSPNITVNPGANVLLSTDCSSYNYKWSDQSTVNTNGNRVVTPSVTTTYSVKCIDGACESASVSTTVVVSTDIAPVISTTAPLGVCEGTSKVLTATGCNSPDIVTWYRIGYTNSIATGTTTTVNLYQANVYTYYASCKKNGVESPASNQITINVYNIPSTPSSIYKAPSTNVNPNTSVILTATRCNVGSIKWEDNSTAYSRTVTPAVTTSYSAKCVDNICESPAKNVAVTVTTDIAPVISTTAPTNVCTGSSKVFTATGCNSPDIVTWYRAYNSISNSSIGTGTTTTVNWTLGSTYPYIYIATCTKNSVESPASNQISINVYDIPSYAPSSITKNPSTSVNPNTSVSLTASSCGSGTTVKWEDNSTTNPRTVTPAVTTTYSAKCVNSTCESATATSVTVTVISPCPNSLNLASNNIPSDDISTSVGGTILKQANSTNGSITATNKITGTAKVTYQAKNIQLNAGFKADNGTVFKAEIGGCQ